MKIRRGNLISFWAVLRHRGERLCRMLLDTGARFTVLKVDLAREIGLDVREVPTMRLVGVGSSNKVSMGTVDSMSLLGDTVRNVNVVCFAIHPRLAVDGIVGMNVLQHFNYAVDNANETFTASKWPQ